MQGHWIAAIGQLPVMVTGAVGCNQFIVASMTEPAMGQPLSAVSDPSAHHRVVALTLEAKETDSPGLVMAFAMFGLPAIAGMLKVTVPSEAYAHFCAAASNCVDAQAQCLEQHLHWDLLHRQSWYISPGSMPAAAWLCQCRHYIFRVYACQAIATCHAAKAMASSCGNSIIL